MNIRLIARHDSLYLPGPPERLLMVQYPEGDCDRAFWPFGGSGLPRYPVSTDRAIAARALFDERECGTFPTGTVIELPDGTVFDFDAYVK
mgnify:CR=1 FL=1